MAADSAITVSRGDTRRIYNNANKIFMISEKPAVGVMVFENMEFMGVPIDVLVKYYRDQNPDFVAKDLKGYVDNFVAFLEKEVMLRGKEQQEEYLCEEVFDFYGHVKREAAAALEDELSARKNQNISEEEKTGLFRDCIRQEIEDLKARSKQKRLLSRYPISRFRAYVKENIDNLMDLCEEDGLPVDMRAEWEEGIYRHMISSNFFNYTGMVFVGYGKDDLFPSQIPISISGIFDDHLRVYYIKEREGHIGFDKDAVISPFAQTDVIMTILKGIAPTLAKIILQSASETLDKVVDTVASAMRKAGVSEETIGKVLDIDKTDIVDQHADTIFDYVQTEYVDELFETVATFDVEDMANMAESLISITSLQRHFTASEETVGGPVEVAVLTRDRGFVWLKHHDWA